MNKKILPVMFVLVFIFLSVKVLSVSNMEMITENNHLALYLNEETAEIAVKNKISDKIWYSNPPDREQDPIASGDRENLLNSQFILSYFQPNNSEKKLNSFKDSIEQDQFVTEKIQKGIKIKYLIGEKWREDDYLPDILNENKFKKIVDELDSSDQDLMYDNFTLIKMVKLGEREQYNLSGINEEELFEDYIIVKVEDGEEIKDREVVYEFLDKYRNYREDIDRNSEIVFNDIKSLRENPAYITKDMPRFIENDVIDVFINSGYDPEEAAQDYLIYNLEPPEPNIFTFDIPVEYTLEGKDLKVRIPVKEINYPFIPGVHNVDIGGYRGGFVVRDYQTLPHQLDLLQYFGAPDSEKKGYIFVPDGSGAIINLNNDKLNESPYAGKIYGTDFAIEPLVQREPDSQEVRLPVYGMKVEDDAFLAIIEEGSALANIRADISGRSSSYNTVYPSFILNNNSDRSIGHAGNIENLPVKVYQPSMPKTDIVLRYKFLSDKEANYVGMAKSFREYLLNQYSKDDNKLRETKSENIPLYLDLVGSLSTVKPILGISREVNLPITTFSQTEKIVDYLQNKEVNNLNLIYSGMLKGAMTNHLPENFRINKKLGSKKEFSSLIDFIKEQENINIYPEVDFMNIYDYSDSNKFDPKKNASRYLSNQIAKKFQYHPAHYHFEEDKFNELTSPDYLRTLMNNFIEDYDSEELNNLSLKNMGRQLHSNMHRDEDKIIDRQEALNIISDLLKKYKKNNSNYILKGGNDYVLPYSDHILEMPLESSGRFITDRSVPFFQIAVSGLLNYTGPPMNETKDKEKIILKSIETGAYPYFQLGYEDQFILKGSPENKFTSVGFDIWKDNLVEIYSEMNTVQKQIKNEQITDHKKIKEDVFITVFENEKAVIVNYSDQSVEVLDITVDSRSYKLIERGDISETFMEK